MTAATLKSLTLKDLAQLAKRKGVRGYQSMRKEQLVRALVKLNGTAKSTKVAPKAAVAKKVTPANRSATKTATTVVKATNGVKAASGVKPSNGVKVRETKPAPRAIQKPIVEKPKSSPAVVRKIGAARAQRERVKNLAFKQPAGHRYTKDRLVVMVRDPFWLHAYWEITRQGVERAEAALAQEWHSARAVLRLLDVSTSSTTSSAEMVIRHIDIHGGVNNWYIDVNDPPRGYRVDIGYLTPSGRFYTLARSNIVTTPKAGASAELDENWSDVVENFDKIYAMSGGYSAETNSSELQELLEERLRRPMGSPVITRYGNGSEAHLAGIRKKGFDFQVDAEMIVFGKTEPNAHVMLQGEPVQLRPDGTFTVRIAMPNARQVIPAVASSGDGSEQRTVVLAVERNTKVMEPLSRDSGE